MPLNLGKASRELRMKLKLSLREAAAELGVSYVHLCNIENGKASPSPETIEKFHDAWGVDLYMYAIAFDRESRPMPEALRAPVKALAAGWKKHIESLVHKRAKEGARPCLISAD